MTQGPQFGLVLCSQFPRDAGFSSVWATQHYLAEEFQYLHPLAVLVRLVPETGDMRLTTEALGLATSIGVPA